MPMLCNELCRCVCLSNLNYLLHTTICYLSCFSRTSCYTLSHCFDIVIVIEKKFKKYSLYILDVSAYPGFWRFAILTYWHTRIVYQQNTKQPTCQQRPLQLPSRCYLDITRNVRWESSMKPPRKQSSQMLSMRIKTEKKAVFFGQSNAFKPMVTPLSALARR